MSSEQAHNDSAATERVNLDGRVFGENGQPDVFIPGQLFTKITYLAFSVGILLLGMWDIWGPLRAVLFGETTEARVAYIVRESPGEADEIIRVRREIREGDYGYDTRFRHFVEVLDANSKVQVYELAVASQQTPYALVNERVQVAYLEGSAYAFGIYHHRTWAFGVSLVFMGFTFIPMAIFLVRMVGKRMEIDPEDPAELEKERLIQAQEAVEAAQRPST